MQVNTIATLSCSSETLHTVLGSGSNELQCWVPLELVWFPWEHPSEVCIHAILYSFAVKFTNPAPQQFLLHISWWSWALICLRGRTPTDSWSMACFFLSLHLTYYMCLLFTCPPPWTQMSLPDTWSQGLSFLNCVLNVRHTVVNE